MKNFEVTTTIFSLENFNYKQPPQDLIQPIGILDTEKKLWKVVDQKSFSDIDDEIGYFWSNEQPQTKFYFLSNNENKFHPLENNEKLILLAHCKNWYTVDIDSDSNITYTKINKKNIMDLSDTRPVLIRSNNENTTTFDSSNLDENNRIRIGSEIFINEQKVTIVLPNGTVTEQGGEYALSINQTKSTRNVLVVISVIVWMVFIMMMDMFLFF